MRRKLFQRVRAKIVNRLFMAKPSFCPQLMEIYGFVYDISQIQVAIASLAEGPREHLLSAPRCLCKQIMKASQTHLYILEEYAEAQTSQREQNAKPTLDNTVEKIQNALENVCKAAQKQARLYQESIRDMSELEDTTGVELYQVGCGPRGAAGLCGRTRGSRGGGDQAHLPGLSTTAGARNALRSRGTVACLIALG